MKKYTVAVFLMLLGSATLLPAIKASAPVMASSLTDLTLIEFKMTGSESVVIQNTSAGAINLKNYWLEYFNKNNPSFPAIASGSQQLPDFSLDTGQTMLLSGDSAPTCGASIVANLSFSLSDTSGYLRLTKVTLQPDGMSTLYTPLDHVSWTSTSSGADLTKVPSNTADPQAVWYRTVSSGAWKQSELSGCSTLAAVTVPGSGKSYAQLSQTAASVPSTHGSPASPIPAADAGLAAPKLSEVLPNPASPQTDADDEFIELYNTNSKAFDLSGFILQTGTTTTHKYTFPAGSSIKAKTFLAFYSSKTSVTLSNTTGQVKLLDPAENVLQQSDIYDKAKDGYAWIFANGSWQWTTQATPNAENVVVAPLDSKPKTGTAASGSVLGASTSSPSSNTSNSTSSGTASKPASIHPMILAGVGSLALLYALYEYRHDLANARYRFRRNRKAGGVPGPADQTTTLYRPSV